MTFSVVIPTFNVGVHFRHFLDVLKKQTLSFELIVIDSSPKDTISEMAHGFGVRMVHIQQEEFDHGGTRNQAVRCANGKFIVFLTQDILPVDEFSLERLVNPLVQDEKITASYGRQLPHPVSSPLSAHLRFFNYPEQSYIYSLEDRRKHGLKTSFLSNSFAAYRRDALEKIGWFREKLIMCEDACAAAEMLMAGYKIAYAADAQVYHSHEYTAAQDFKRYFDIGVFHKLEPWLIQEFGRAEGEGKRFIQSGLAFLRKRNQYHHLPEFILRAALKYAGYKLGNSYDKLPASIVKKLSMHRHYWEN